jgi:hypothetical protein
MSSERFLLDFILSPGYDNQTIRTREYQSSRVSSGKARNARVVERAEGYEESSHEKRVSSQENPGKAERVRVQENSRQARSLSLGFSAILHSLPSPFGVDKPDKKERTNVQQNLNEIGCQENPSE